MISKELLAHWPDILATREIAGVGDCVVRRFIFTMGLLVDVTIDESVCDFKARYCYEDPSDAVHALVRWNGVGHPPGPWIKEKVSGVVGPGAKPRSAAMCPASLCEFGIWVQYKDDSETETEVVHRCKRCNHLRPPIPQPGSAPKPPAAPPVICPRCGHATEIAKARPRFHGQKAAHWQFKNGSYVVSPKRLPAPTKCAPCNRGWAINPGDETTILEIPEL